MKLYRNYKTYNTYSKKKCPYFCFILKQYSSLTLAFINGRFSECLFLYFLFHSSTLFFSTKSRKKKIVPVLCSILKSYSSLTFAYNINKRSIFSILIFVLFISFHRTLFFFTVPLTSHPCSTLRSKHIYICFCGLLRKKNNKLNIYQEIS